MMRSTRFFATYVVLMGAIVCEGGVGGTIKPQTLGLSLEDCPDTFGKTCVVGGAAYINLSLPGGPERLEHMMDLPRCMHEGASWKEREGWKITQKEKKMQRKMNWKEKRIMLAERKKANAAAVASTKMAFAAAPSLPIGPLLSCLPAARRFSEGLLASITMLSDMGSSRTLGSRHFLPPITRPLSPFLLNNPMCHRKGVVMMSGGKGFGLTAPEGSDSNKDKDGKKKSGLRGDAKNPVREVEMQFTCNKCETRQSKIFTRMAYEKGVVIVVCNNPACQVKHLIADNIGWYKDWTGDAGGINVEQMMKAKGLMVENRLGEWSPEAEEEGIKMEKPASKEGVPLVMKRRDDGTYEVLDESEA